MASLEEKKAIYQELKRRGALEGKSPELVSELEKRFGDSEVTTTPPEKMSSLESARRGVAEGLTFGASERLGSAFTQTIPATQELVGRGVNVVGGLLGSPAIKEFGQRQVRGGGSFPSTGEELVAEEKSLTEKSKAAHPVIHTTGGIVGALPVGIAASIAAPATIPAQAAVGASLGGVTAFGETEDVKEAAKGLLIGGAVGVAGGGLQKASKPFMRASTALGRKAIGFIKSVVNKAGGPEKADKAVNILLEHGAIKGGIRKIAENVDALRESSGKVIGETLKRLDSAGVKGIFNADKLKSSLLGKNLPGTRMTVGGFMELPINKGMKNQFDEIIETANSSQFADETFESAQEFKNVLREKINFSKDSAERNLYLKAYLTVRDTIDDAVMKAAPKIGDDALAAEFQAAKDAYGAAKIAEVAIDSELRRSTGNRILSLTDFVISAGRGPVSGPATVIGKKILESTPVMAAGARGMRTLGGLAGAVGRPVGVGVTGSAGGISEAIRGR